MPRPPPARCRAAGAPAPGLRGALLALALRCWAAPPGAWLATAPRGPRRSGRHAPSVRPSFWVARRPLTCRPQRSTSGHSSNPASQLATEAEIVFAGAPGEKPDVFLSHDWGVDELLRSNHERVARVNEALKARGLVTWLDEERLEGYIIDQISEGIENSKVVVVFMTQQYYNKVNGDDSADYCKLEFEYALRRRGRANMVVCVMEPRMRDSRRWQGPVGLGLGGSLYLDLAGDEDFEQAMDRLAELVRGRIAGAPLAAPGPAPAAGAGEAPGPWPRLLGPPPKPTSLPQAVFLLLVAMAGVVYYAIEIVSLPVSGFVSFLQESFGYLWEAILALIAAL